MNQIRILLVITLSISLSCLPTTCWARDTAHIVSPLSFSNPLEYFEKVTLNQKSSDGISDDSSFDLDRMLGPTQLITHLMESNTTSHKCNQSLIHFAEDLAHRKFYTIKGITYTICRLTPQYYCIHFAVLLSYDVIEC